MYPAKNCDQSDFGDDEKSKEFFKSWTEYDSLICPDLPGVLDLEMMNSPSHMIQKKWSIHISKCY